MSGGFALVAWPAQYDATGVMTFVVSQDGIVHEKDLGPKTDAVARGCALRSRRVVAGDALSVGIEHVQTTAG